MRNTINVPLLRQIQSKALEFPKTITMQTWGMVSQRDVEHPCGAVACIAGTAVLICKPKLFVELTESIESGDGNLFFRAKTEFRDVATRVLSLTKSQAQRLFFITSWPACFYLAWVELGNRYDLSNDLAMEKARVFAGRIDHFIKTEGAE